MAPTQITNTHVIRIGTKGWQRYARSFISRIVKVSDLMSQPAEAQRATARDVTLPNPQLTTRDSMHSGFVFRRIRRTGLMMSDRTRAAIGRRSALN